VNELKGIIESTESDEDLTLAVINVSGKLFSAIVIETPDTVSYLRKGTSVIIFFKETEVAVAKNRTGEISLRNRFPCPVKRIRTGGILCEITFDMDGAEIVSVITRRSVERLDLKEGEEAEWLIKATEISIKEDNG